MTTATAQRQNQSSTGAAEGGGSRGGEHAAPIIVIKRASHAGHHGGAWKVAYADFVTSMMCLFIVLWIVGQDEQVKQAVATYFRDPGAFHKSTSGSLLSAEGAGLLGQHDAERAALEGIAAQLREQLADSPDLQQIASQIEIKMTDEGLNIQMVENANSLFFAVGSAELNPNAQKVLLVLASKLGGLANRMAIEGHTDSRPYPLSAAYTNWELSSDRANSARRFLLAHGLRASQVSEVTGYADTRLRNPNNATDVANRRISLTVLYSDAVRAGTNPTPGSNAAPAPKPEHGNAQAHDQ